MRSFIFFIISVLIFLLPVIAVSFVLPSRVVVTRSVVIHKPKVMVKEQVENFTNWRNWYPPLQNNGVSVVKNNENEVLLKDSSGRQILLKMDNSKNDTLEISFESISSSKIKYQFLFAPNNADSTKVILNVFTTFKWYPWQKLKGIVLDKMTGPMYEETLRNLKKAVEANKPDSLSKNEGQNFQ